MVRIGERVKHIRKSKGLNQDEFAKQIEISQSMLSGIESGREILTDRNVKLICLEFGVNMEWLKNGDGPIFNNLELTANEKELLEIYDKLIPETQKEIRDYAREKLELQKLRKQAGIQKREAPPETPQEAEIEESIA
jgi:transcriptional regulator with XRE-family HTH domain